MNENIVTVEIPAPKVKTPRIVSKRGFETRYRIGRGYSIGEIKQAGLSIKLAKQLNIPIDFRRRSIHQHNVENLKKVLDVMHTLIVARKTKPARIVQQSSHQKS